MSNKFSDVFVNLDMDMTDRELMKNAEITKISVPSDKSSLTVYVKNKEDIPRSTIYAAEDAIREKIFGGKNLRVNITLTVPAQNSVAPEL